MNFCSVFLVDSLESTCFVVSGVGGGDLNKGHSEWGINPHPVNPHVSCYWRLCQEQAVKLVEELTWLNSEVTILKCCAWSGSKSFT